MISSVALGPSGQLRIGIYNPGCDAQSLDGVYVSMANTTIHLGPSMVSIASGSIKIICNVVSPIAQGTYPCDTALGYGLAWGSKGDVVHLVSGRVLDSVDPGKMADATGQSGATYVIGRLACVGWSADRGGCAALAADGSPSTWKALPAGELSLRCRPSPSRAECDVPQTILPACI